MTGGLLILGAGVWVLCQVFGGNALGRVGITGRGGNDDQAETPPTWEA